MPYKLGLLIGDLIAISIFIAPIVLTITLLYLKNKKGKKQQPEFNEQPTIIYPQKTEDYKSKYQIKFLLTKNEWYEYKKLHEVALKHNLQICPKVRLADIIEPRKGTGEWQKLFYKIQAKHIDFLICDYNLKILAVLELDDNSHNQPDRHERDKFVDEILRSVGYKVIRTRAVTDEVITAALNLPTLAPGAHGGQG